MNELENEALLALLGARGAAEIAHPGGTLLAHLQRTASTLAAWGAAPELVAAGAYHAVYGTAAFPVQLLTLAERDVLRAAIGDEAEAIVYAYCALDRGTLESGSAGEWRDRFGGEYTMPSVRLRRQLAELACANELDILAQAALSAGDSAAIAVLLAHLAPQLSQAAWSAVLGRPQLQALASTAQAPLGDSEIAYRDFGSSGPSLVLWHGGAGPELTWARQHPLASEYRLRSPWRRGFAPSCPATRADWEVDARDLLRIMPERAHVVAHSYGGVSALVAAALAPERFASLVVIEAPLSAFAAEDPAVQRLAALGRAFAQGVPDVRSAFLALAGLPIDHPQTLRTERLARDFRDPAEATPLLAPLRAAGLAISVVSGDHNHAIETICDAVCSALDAERWVIRGAGHAVQRAPEFNHQLRAHIDGLEAKRTEHRSAG